MSRSGSEPLSAWRSGIFHCKSLKSKLLCRELVSDFGLKLNCASPVGSSGAKLKQKFCGRSSQSSRRNG
jgi:hypothetical protein